MFDTWEAMRPVVMDFLPKALLAIVCGGLIGVEREIKSKPAGFKTNILICLGSMMFMWLSTQVAMTIATGRPADPGRIASQVVTGIGFLGAGTIIQSRGRIQGLTSAAMIWVVAAVGMSIGSGYSEIGVIATALILVVLVGLGLVEKKMFRRCVYSDSQVVFDDRETTRELIDRALRGMGRPIEALSLRRSGEQQLLTFQCCEVHPQHRRLLQELWKIRGVREIRPLH